MWRMRYGLVFATVFSALLFSLDAAMPKSWVRTLAAAGANAAQLELAWNQCPEAQRRGMEFLVESMPARDAATLKGEFLVENVRLAYEARAAMPWGKDIPEDIFLNDVLPYAVLDESRDHWRADFLKRFTAVIGDAKDASTARERINARISQELGVTYNTKRRAPNQGPAESMERKMASCTGLSILLCDALRSVCIPCRIAGTAMWTTMEGNHNWNEVWLPETKRWMFTEYDPDSKGLDHGWLLSEAARGIVGSQYHGVFATSWQRQASSSPHEPSRYFPLVWNMKDTSVPAWDVTQRYIDLGAPSLPQAGECELRIDAVSILADGSEQRQARKVSLRQADVVVKDATTPTSTADTNEFLVIKVKQGQRYQLLLLDDQARPLEERVVAPTKLEAQLRLKLVIKNSPDQR